MAPIELFAVLPSGPVPLPVPAQAHNVHDMYDELPVGVYSGLRTYQHDKFLRLDDHLARTEQSAVALGWTVPLDQARLRRALHEVVTRYPLSDARVRFDFLPSALPVAGGDHTSRLLVGLSPFVAVAQRHLDEGVALAWTTLRRATPLIKTTDFVIERRVCSRKNPQAYEHLMTDERGLVLEGISVNFFGVRRGVIVTAGAGVLEGITRRIVLELARELDLEVSLEGVLAGQIDELDEAFITSSSRQLVPVRSIADHPVGQGGPGPITARLQRAYTRYARDHVRPAWP